MRIFDESLVDGDAPYLSGGLVGEELLQIGFNVSGVGVENAFAVHDLPVFVHFVDGDGFGGDFFKHTGELGDFLWAEVGDDELLKVGVEFGDFGEDVEGEELVAQGVENKILAEDACGVSAGLK